MEPEQAAQVVADCAQQRQKPQPPMTIDQAIEAATALRTQPEGLGEASARTIIELLLCAVLEARDAPDGLDRA